MGFNELNTKGFAMGQKAYREGRLNELRAEARLMGALASFNEGYYSSVQPLQNRPMKYRQIIENDAGLLVLRAGEIESTIIMDRMKRNPGFIPESAWANIGDNN